MRLDLLLAGDPQLTTPEFRLVAAATRWPQTTAAGDHMRALAADVRDWRRVARIVDRHRIPGLASAAIDLLCPDAGVRAHMAANARQSAMQELRFAYETLRLVRLLEGAGIPVRVIKGVTAALLAFGRFGVRFSMDVDLLIRPRDVPAASAILTAAGYGRTEPAADAGPAAMRARMARYKDLVFEHPDSGAVVELHWRLFQNPHLLRGPDLDRREPLELLPGVVVHGLPRDLSILYLFAHGTEHGWARLKWLADIGAILAGAPQREVERLYAKARGRGAHRLVVPGLVLSHALYGTHLPEAARRDSLRDWRIRSLVRTAYASLVGDEDGIELEDRPHGTTRKNLSHYCLSADPRFLFSEARYDLLDRVEGEAAGGYRIARLAGRLLGLARRRSLADHHSQKSDAPGR